MGTGKDIVLYSTHDCRAREALRQCLPDQLKDQTFVNCLKDDNSTKRWLSQLLKNLDNPGLSPAPGAAAMPSQP